MDRDGHGDDSEARKVTDLFRGGNVQTGMRGLLLFVCSVAWAQTPKVEFEVASVKPSGPRPADHVNIGLRIDGAQVSAAFFSLKDYLGMAFRMKEYQITGPEWIASERYTVNAKLPDGAKREQVPEMLQSLIVDRFQIKMHRESKEFQVYALVVGKGGPKFKEAVEDPAANAGAVTVNVNGGPQGTTVQMGNGSSFTLANNRVETKKLPMVGLADTLARFVDRPVVDMTELKGNYDVTLEFSPDDFRVMMIRAAMKAGVVLPPQATRMVEESSDDGLLRAVESVGLKLERRKAPLDVLVVERAVKTPTEN